MKKISIGIIVFLSIFIYNYINKDPVVETVNTHYSEPIESTQSNVENLQSIDNYSKIRIGDSLETVTKLIGEPARIDPSEYDFQWYVYNEEISKFAMVGIQSNKVVSLYSNSLNNVETEGINLDDSRESIPTNYESLEYKKKGSTKFILNTNNEYDIFSINDKYITIFYDMENEEKVCSYQIVLEEVENTTDSIYANYSLELQQAYELQTIDLVNSTRIKHGLETIEYREDATISARSHSEDMKVNNFFDHVNLDGKSPFDRMKVEGVSYVSAGENIAAGQTSAIYAHEAWMNSPGHRKNILGDYKYIGVGVSFGGHYKMYYTQNFYT